MPDQNREINQASRKLIHGDTMDDLVADYHLSDFTGPIHEFLGCTRREYAAWVKDPAQIPETLSLNTDPEQEK